MIDKTTGIDVGIKQENLANVGIDKNTSYLNELGNQTEADTATFGEKLKTGMLDESIVGQIAKMPYNAFIDSDFKMDDNFQENKDEIVNAVAKEYGIEEHWLGAIKDRARNIEHLQNELIPEFKERQREKNATDDSFLGGILYYGSGAMVDALTIGKFLKVADNSSFAFNMMKDLTKTKARNIATYTGIESGLELTKEMITSERDRTIFENVSSVVLGGALGGVLNKPVGLEIEEALKTTDSILKTTLNVSQDTIDKASDLLKKGKRDDAIELVKKDNRKAVGELKQTSEDRMDTVNSIMNNLDKKNELTGMTKKVYDSMRFDLGWSMQHSSSPTMRRLMDDYLEDPLMRKNIGMKENEGAVVPGIRRAELHKDDILTAFTSSYEELYKDFYKEITNTTNATGIRKLYSGVIETFSSKRNMLHTLGFDLAFDMENAVAKGLKSEEELILEKAKELSKVTGLEMDKAKEFVNRTLNAQREVSKKIYDSNVRAGVRQFVSGEIPRKDFYVPNQYRKGILPFMMNKTGISRKEYGKFFADSHIKASDKEFTAEESKKLSKAMSKWIEAVTGKDAGHISILKRDLQQDHFTDELINEFGKEDANRLFGVGKIGNEQTKNLKFRKLFDRSHTMKLENGNEIKFSDFLEKNVESLYAGYAKRIANRNSMTKLKNFNYVVEKKYIDEETGKEVTEYLEHSLETDESLDALYRQIRSEINSADISGRMKEIEMERAYHTFNHVVGNPTVDNPYSMANKATNILNSLTIFSKMGQTGLAIVAELNNAVFRSGGMKKFAENFSFKNSYLDRIKNGKVDDELSQEIYEFFHAGNFVNKSYNDDLRLDDGLDPYAVDYDRGKYSTFENIMNIAENVSQKLASVTMTLSGNNALVSGIEHGIASRIIHQFLTNINGKEMAEIRREMNISDGMFKRITEQMNKYTDIIDGDRVYKLDENGVEKFAGKQEWTDTVKSFDDIIPEQLDTTLKNILKRFGAEGDVSKHIANKSVARQLSNLYGSIKQVIDNKSEDEIRKTISDTLGLKDSEIDSAYNEVVNVANNLKYTYGLAKKFPVASVELKRVLSDLEGNISSSLGHYITNPKMYESGDLVSMIELSRKTNKSFNEIISTLNHELFHSATVLPYNTIPKYKSIIDSIYKQIARDLSGSHYGKTNAKEMLAEAFSNKNFAEQLNNMKPNKNVFENFQDLRTSKDSMFDDIDVSKELGIDLQEGNLLDYLLRATKMVDSNNVILKVKEPIAKGSRVKRLNIDAWDDDEAVLAMRAGITRVVGTYMQKGLYTDLPGITLGGRLLQDTPYGRLFMNLKNYMFVSYTKQLGRYLHNMDAKHSSMLASQIVLMSAVVTMQNIMNNAGDEEKMKKSFEFGNFTSAVMNKSTIGSYAGLVSGLANLAVTGSDGRSNTASIALKNEIAPLTVLDDLVRFSSSGYNLLTGNVYQATKGLTGIFPNYYGVETATRALEAKAKKYQHEKDKQND